MMPPEHDEIGAIRYPLPNASQGFDITVAKCLPHGRSTDKRRIPDNEIRRRPLGLTRIQIPQHHFLCALIRHLLAGHRMHLRRPPIPTRHRLPISIDQRLHPVIRQHRVAALDVVELLDHRLRRQHVATGAEMPLQITDPQHHVGDGGGAGIDLDAEELVRIDGEAGELQRCLFFAEAFEGIENFPLQTLEMFKGDVQKVAAAAGGIENPQRTELVVELLDQSDGAVTVPLPGQSHARRQHRVPIGAQRLDHRRQHQSLDVFARRVVGAEMVAFRRV